MVDGVLLDRCRRIAELAAMLVITIAVAAMAGWVLDIEALRSVVPGMVAMNPMSAACFVLASLALGRYRLVRGAINADMLGVGCGFLITFIGASRVLAYLTPWNLGMDRMMFIDILGDNQMAPNTASNFMLLGIALSLTASGRWTRLAQCFVVVSSTVSCMALLGYLYKVPLFGIPGYFPMAFHVSICFLLVEMGLLLGNAQSGFVAMIMSSRSGGRAARRLLPAIVLLPTSLGFLGIHGMRTGWSSAEFAVALMATFCSVGLAALLLPVTRWLNAGDEEIERLCTIDTLTGLLNRYTILRQLGAEAAACLRARQPIATAMVDIDHFKLINDSHGHAAGDVVLARIGGLIRSTLRADDAAGRYGGEEFIVLLPRTGIERAALFAERLRRLIATTEIEVGSGLKLNVTCSIGVSEITAADVHHPELALACADAALYSAKREGRNCVKVGTRASHATALQHTSASAA